jgi:hypothetical protein
MHMRFNKRRATVFGEYTITAMLNEAAKRKKTFVAISKPDFSKILGTQKLRPEHIDLVRATALEEGVGMANMGHTLVFFYFEGIERACEPLSARRGRDVTDAFERVYGSDAADEMWENRTYPKREQRRAS